MKSYQSLLNSPLSLTGGDHQINVFDDTSQQVNNQISSNDISNIHYSSPSSVKSTDSLDLLGLQTEIMELENDDEPDDANSKAPKTEKKTTKTNVAKEKAVKSRPRRTKRLDEGGDEPVVKRTQRRAAARSSKYVEDSESD